MSFHSSLQSFPSELSVVLRQFSLVIKSCHAQNLKGGTKEPDQLSSSGVNNIYECCPFPCFADISTKPYHYPIMSVFEDFKDEKVEAQAS